MNAYIKKLVAMTVRRCFSDGCGEVSFFCYHPKGDYSILAENGMRAIVDNDSLRVFTYNGYASFRVDEPEKHMSAVKETLRDWISGVNFSNRHRNKPETQSV